MSLQTTTCSPTRNETCDNKAHIFPSHPCTNKTQRPTTNFGNSNNKGAGHSCNSRFKQVVLPGLPLQQGPNTAATRIASSTFFSAAPLRLVVAATKLAAATLVGHSCHFFCQLNCSLLCCAGFYCNTTAT